MLQGQGENMPTEAKARDRRAAAMWEKVQGYLDPNTEFDTEVDSRTECMSSCALLLISTVSHLKIDLAPFAKVQQATCMSTLLCEMEFISTTLLRDPRSICDLDIFRNCVHLSLLQLCLLHRRSKILE